MSQVHLIVAFHSHQPVGSLEADFEKAFRSRYQPLLDVLAGYPDIPFVVHFSGPVLEWLVDRQPEYVAGLESLVSAGRVEVLGGGLFEPVLPMIPHRDRIGQIRSLSSFLGELFLTRVRGMWLAEGVWEQHVVTALVDAGIEYTILDDCHFERAGCAADDLGGYYLTENEGRLLKVFPASEPLRRSILADEPRTTYEFLRRLAERRPGSTIVFADPGHEVGTANTRETSGRAYPGGWLQRLCDLLVANRSWIELTTFAQAVDHSLPLGKVYLPDGSYRGGAERFIAASAPGHSTGSVYSESEEMYARMLGVSQRLAAAADSASADPDYLEAAHRELYSGQCSDAYWHGGSGGLYLPHLRNAIYGSLIAAEQATDSALDRAQPRLGLEVGDFNLDARQEVRLENDQLIALVRPALGGHIYELDMRQPAVNLLATLDRRPEAHQGKIGKVAAGSLPGGHGARDAAAEVDHTGGDPRGLAKLLVYNSHPRKALVDHFYPRDLTLDDLVACRETEYGDFATGTYLAKVHRQRDCVALVMERSGLVKGCWIRLRKTIALGLGDPSLSVRYEVEDVPPGASLHLAVEINLASFAGDSPSCYYAALSGSRLGRLAARLDMLDTRGLVVTDCSRELSIRLSWSVLANLWAFPIESTRQADLEVGSTYQSSAILPHWHITPDDRGRWEVSIVWTLDRRASGSTFVERSSIPIGSEAR